MKVSKRMQWLALGPHYKTINQTIKDLTKELQEEGYEGDYPPTPKSHRHFLVTNEIPPKDQSVWSGKRSVFSSSGVTQHHHDSHRADVIWETMKEGIYWPPAKEDVPVLSFENLPGREDELEDLLVEQCKVVETYMRDPLEVRMNAAEEGSLIPDDEPELEPEDGVAFWSQREFNKLAKKRMAPVYERQRQAWAKVNEKSGAQKLAEYRTREDAYLWGKIAQVEELRKEKEAKKRKREARSYDSDEGEPQQGGRRKRARRSKSRASQQPEPEVNNQHYQDDNQQQQPAELGDYLHGGGNQYLSGPPPRVVPEKKPLTTKQIAIEAYGHDVLCQNGLFYKLVARGLGEEMVPRGRVLNDLNRGMDPEADYWRELFGEWEDDEDPEAEN